MGNSVLNEFFSTQLEARHHNGTIFYSEKAFRKKRLLLEFVLISEQQQGSDYS